MGGRAYSVESRSRSGCRRCRERRVKCPENRPICSHCQRLGFKCLYEMKLRWEAPTHKSIPTIPISGIRGWMFINARHDDFCFDPIPQDLKVSPLEPARYSVSPKLCPSIPMPLSLSPSTRMNGTILGVIGAGPHDEEQNHHLCLTGFTRCPSPLNLSPDEHYLWNYFDSCIAPQCVQNPDLNPYRDIILRTAAASKEGPLRYCVLAVAANQLHSIGLVKYKAAMWLYRDRALRLLRAQIAVLAHASSFTSCKAVVINEQIIASTLMLCFFEISQNCSRSWAIHADFARNFLRASLYSHDLFSVEQQRLQSFVFAYFVSHDVFAATAGSRLIQNQEVAEPFCFIHESDILALTGCTKKLIMLISEINILCSLREKDDYSTSVSLTRRRNEAEQQLCQLRDMSTDQPPALLSSSTLEIHAIFEVKRQAALMYLYGRLDEAGPQEPHMARITDEILRLIQHISIRTNTLLWPLFIVAVMGIRNEDEENRKFLLEKLTALQETRQLGNVTKARWLIEDVWKARSLHQSQTWKGWSILEGRYNAVSLA